MKQRTRAAADYRRKAQEAREIAEWIALIDTKRQLLELAQHLEALAEIEEQEARKVAPIENPKPEP